MIIHTSHDTSNKKKTLGIIDVNDFVRFLNFRNDVHLELIIRLEFDFCVVYILYTLAGVQILFTYVHIILHFFLVLVNHSRMRSIAIGVRILSQVSRIKIWDLSLAGYVLSSP